MLANLGFHESNLFVATALMVGLVVGLMVLVSLARLVALFGGYAVVRMARRYSERADRWRPGSSASADVWMMHKAPDYDRGDGPLE